MLAKSRLLCLFALTALLSCLFFSLPAAAVPIVEDQRLEIITMVKSAVKLIEAKGEAAFTELNVENGPWHKGATAIFVSDEQGVELVNAAQPKMVGKNLWDYKDANGKLVVQEQWKLVKAKGEGWMDCQWVKPGASKAVFCRAFLKMATYQGKHYMVGAAYYPE